MTISFSLSLFLSFSGSAARSSVRAVHSRLRSRAKRARRGVVFSFYLYPVDEISDRPRDLIGSDLSTDDPRREIVRRRECSADIVSIRSLFGGASEADQSARGCRGTSIGRSVEGDLKLISVDPRDSEMILNTAID